MWMVGFFAVYSKQLGARYVVATELPFATFVFFVAKNMRPNYRCGVRFVRFLKSFLESRQISQGNSID